MENNYTGYQHGDVLIKRVANLPDGVEEVARQNGQLVVMDGELTGHKHVITQKGARLLELKGELYLEVTEPVTISHDEHKPIEIPEGIYQVGQVKEYDYLTEMERNVAD